MIIVRRGVGSEFLNKQCNFWTNKSKPQLLGEEGLSDFSSEN